MTFALNDDRRLLTWSLDDDVKNAVQVHFQILKILNDSITKMFEELLYCEYIEIASIEKPSLTDN